MNSKIYDFDKVFTLYDGTPWYEIVEGVLTDRQVKMNLLLSNNLRTQKKGDIYKIDDWARALFTTGKLILDESDKKVLIKIIEDAELFIQLKRQLLDVLKQGKDVPVPSEK